MRLSQSKRKHYGITILFAACVISALISGLHITKRSRSSVTDGGLVLLHDATYPSFCRTVLPLDSQRRIPGLHIRDHLPSWASMTAGRTTAQVVSDAVEASQRLDSDSSSALPQSIRLRLDVADLPKHAGPYPRGSYRGQGVVIVSGGKRYTPPAYACLMFLRKSGCQLPVEIWTPPHETLPTAVVRQFEGQGAVVRSLGTVFPSRAHHLLTGYASKPAAVLASRFSEVLLLDSDNVPLRDPTFLFDHQLYRDTGLLVRPDFWPCEADQAALTLLGIPRDIKPAGSHESGQLVIDKQRGWTPLLLALFMNLHGDVFYPILSKQGQGDKETFVFAWLALLHRKHTQNKYGRIPFPVMAVGEWIDNQHKGYAMLQRGPDGVPLCIHVHFPKLDLNVEMSEYKRQWLNLTYGTNHGVLLVPPEATSADPKSYVAINNAAGFDVEVALHEFRQQMRCDLTWASCCLQ